MDSTGISSGPVGIRLIAILLSYLSVLLGIGIDDDANHAQLLGTLHLQPAEDAAILDQGNLSRQADVCLDQVFKVVVRAKVCIHNGRSHVATGRVSVEGRHATVEPTRAILLKHILLEGSLKRDLRRIAVQFQ